MDVKFCFSVANSYFSFKFEFLRLSCPTLQNIVCVCVCVCVCVYLFDYFLSSSFILFVEIFLYCRREGEKDYRSFIVVLQGRDIEDVGVGEVCVWFNFVCLCITLQKRERLLE
jgi:hypothetical protein